MRSMRAVGAALALLLLAPGLLAAQQGRQFRDAWFWGLKGGGVAFARPGDDPTATAGPYENAPFGGVDWLITRTRAGLYVSFGQAFFTDSAAIPGSSSLNGDDIRVVDVKNMRRLDVAVVGFPGQWVRVHPYVGVGFTMNALASAEPRGPFDDETERVFAETLVQEGKTVFSPMFLGGVQYRFPMASVFGQVSVSPSQQGFLMYNNRPVNVGYEIGIRYNIGSSISRDR